MEGKFYVVDLVKKSKRENIEQEPIEQVPFSRVNPSIDFLFYFTVDCVDPSRDLH